MNSSKCEETDSLNIIIKTNLESTTTEKNYIRRRRKTEWFKKCKKCDDVMYYSSKGNLQYSIRENRDECLSCKRTIRLDKIYYRNCPKCDELLSYTSYITCERQNRITGLCRCCTQSHKIIKSFMRVCPTCQKTINCKSSSIRNKANKRNRSCLSCSISKKNRIRHQMDRDRNGIVSVPCFNRNACLYFDSLNVSRGWNLVHALNGGEFHIKSLGYWVDAYDKNLNVVVEYDEAHHFKKDGSLKDKDINRMNEIYKLLNCKFFRYNEKLNELKEFFP